MKFLEITHELSSDSAWIVRTYWFKYYESELGPLENVEGGQYVVVDTQHGLAIGRVVSKDPDGTRLKALAGMKPEDVTRQVVTVFDTKNLERRKKRETDFAEVNEELKQKFFSEGLEKGYIALSIVYPEFRELLQRRSRIAKELAGEE